MKSTICVFYQSKKSRFVQFGHTSDKFGENMSEISERVLSSFRSSQSFRDYSANEERRVTAIKFTSSGKYLMATNNKALIEIFDCNTSKHSIVPVKKYGCHKFDFVDENQIVVASAFPRKNNFVSLLDVEKQHYVTFYAGHSAHVKSVSVTPNRNVFLTASIDERVLLWDVRQPYAQGQLVVPEHYKYLAPPIDNSNMGPMLDCHPSGQFFAVGVDSQFLGLHDFRNIDLGPFIRPFTYKRDDSNWSSVKFSSDGNQMVIGTTSPKVRVIETKMGKLQNVFPGKLKVLAILTKNLILFRSFLLA